MIKLCQIQLLLEYGALHKSTKMKGSRLGIKFANASHSHFFCQILTVDGAVRELKLGNTCGEIWDTYVIENALQSLSYLN